MQPAMRSLFKQSLEPCRGKHWSDFLVASTSPVSVRRPDSSDQFSLSKQFRRVCSSPLALEKSFLYSRPMYEEFRDRILFDRILEMEVYNAVMQNVGLRILLCCLRGMELDCLRL